MEWRPGLPIIDAPLAQDEPIPMDAPADHVRVLDSPDHVLNELAGGEN